MTSRIPYYNILHSSELLNEIGKVKSNSLRIKRARIQLEKE